MSIRIGAIAEDRSDIDVLECLIRKVRPNRQFKVKPFLGHGCGKIRSKCHAWASALASKGCRLLIVLHDLDKANEGQLRNLLTKALKPCPIPRHVIVIPIREIEAWLLSDSRAIDVALKLQKRIRRISNPENDPDPKSL